MTIVSPSILSADFSNLERDIKKVEPYVKWLHLDVMDGHFVDNITFGPDLVRSIRKKTNLFLDTHLMIENPKKYIIPFIEAGSDLITFHYEAAVDDTKECIDLIKSQNKMTGLSIKPKTDIEKIIPFLDYLDMVLIMTVEPGFGGQNFMEECLLKVSFIREINKDIIIQVDGGINDKTAILAKNAGANSLVAGSYIYKSENIEYAIKSLL